MSVLVDSSVWINHMRGYPTQAVQKFRSILADQSDALITADLVVHELVRGCRSDSEAKKVESTLLQFRCETVGGIDDSLRAAHLYRKLRARGTTISKTVDLFIASWCIHEKVALLHDDADFDAFAPFGLRCV